MARRLGVSNQRWSNVTRGLPLGMDLTRRLVTRFPGLTTDWAVVRPNGRHERRDGRGTWARGVELAFGHHEDRTPTSGHEATREAAMAPFAKSWRWE